MVRLSLSFLGPFQVALDGQPATGFESARVRALLAYLTVEAAHSHSREALTGLLWPDWPQPSANANFRQALANLRACIGDREADPSYLLISRETIQFNRESDYTLDVATFTALLKEARGSPPAVERWQQAVSLYRGSFLEGFSLSDSPAFESWVTLQREHLAREMLAVLGRLAGYYEGCAEYEQAREYAQRQVDLDPTQEEGQRQLMRALALSGQRSAALAQYQGCRRVLAEELSVEPERETVTLYETIRDGKLGAPDAAVAPAASTPTSVLGAAVAGAGRASLRRPSNLPAQTVPFVGREGLLGEIEGRLRDPACRLLSLVGLGGCGKTRLALEVGERVRKDGAGLFADGVFAVSLAPLRSVESVVPVIAAAVGFSFAGSGDTRPAEVQLLKHLRDKELLLILDNYEHLLEGAPLVTRILEAAPGVKVLATSRVRLNLQAEHVLVIGGMALPGTQTGRDLGGYSAVKLFLQSARQVRSGYEPAPEEFEQIAAICRRVRGMPLAILLAAGWMEVLGPGEIVAEIGRSLDFLEGGARDLPERQRSLRAVFEHSWQLLSPHEQEVLAALSVFRGSFSGQAAAEVAGATLRDLRSLADKSLLAPLPRSRYGVHELLRQYAAGRLEAAPERAQAVRSRHARHYADLLRGWEPYRMAGSDEEAPAEMDADIEDARAAWERLVAECDLDGIERALRPLALFYFSRGRFEEGKTACETAVAALSALLAGSPVNGGRRPPPNGPALRALGACLVHRGFFESGLGQIRTLRATEEQALEYLAEAQAAGTDARKARAEGLYMLSRAVATDVGDYQECARLTQQSVELLRGLEVFWSPAELLAWLGWLKHMLGAEEEARQLLEEGAALARTYGDRNTVAMLLSWLGSVSAALGRFGEAVAAAHEALAIWTEHGDRERIKSYASYVSDALMAAGRFAEAERVMEQAVAAERLSEHYEAMRRVSLGQARLHQGLYAQARAEFQRVAELSREYGYSLGMVNSATSLGDVALAEGDCAATLECYERARTLDPELAVFGTWYASVHVILAELGVGQRARAREELTAQTRRGSERKDVLGASSCVAAAAVWLAGEGQAERAVELYALASQHPHIAASRWWEKVAGRHVAAAAAGLPAEVVAAARERGRQRGLREALKALLEQLSADETGQVTT